MSLKKSPLWCPILNFLYCYCSSSRVYVYYESKSLPASPPKFAGGGLGRAGSLVRHLPADSGTARLEPSGLGKFPERH